jgi:protein-S-isoprenylcysteine O-methyltransferase Ste14
LLLLTFWQWRPLGGALWSIDLTAVRILLHVLCAGGWLLVLYSTFCIDHFDLFGLRQVVLYFRKTEYTSPGFALPWLYKLVRNPLMLGFLTAFWATPDMSYSRLVFALLTTGYVFIGIAFEERDLAESLGESYRQYRRRTPMILPFPRPSVTENDSAVAT